MLENTSGKTSGWYSYLLINRNQIEEDRFIEDNILIPNTKTPLI